MEDANLETEKAKSVSIKKIVLQATSVIGQSHTTQLKPRNNFLESFVFIEKDSLKVVVLIWKSSSRSKARTCRENVSICHHEALECDQVVSNNFRCNCRSNLATTKQQQVFIEPAFGTPSKPNWQHGVKRAIQANI